MHAIRRLVPFGLIALSSAIAQTTPNPTPTPTNPAVPVPAPPAAPAGALPPGVPTTPPGGAAPGGNNVRPPRGNNPAPAAARAEAEAEAAVPLAEHKILEPIFEPKLTGSDLSSYYSQFTGRRVILSTAAAAAEFAFIQQASKEHPLTYREATELLKKAALIEGFVFVPSGDGVDKLLLAGGTGPASPTGLPPIYDENDVLPDGDQVIIYVMTLKYLKPETAVSIFGGVIGQGQGLGTIVPVPNASAVVVTGNTALIRNLIVMKEQIDKSTVTPIRKMFSIQYADVTELAQTLNELFSAQQQGATQRVSNNRAPQNPGQPGQPNMAAANSGGAGEEVPIQIIPDARTNRILAMGTPSDVAYVESLIKDFDTKTDQKNFMRRKLRFLAANDFLDVASNALNRNFTGTGGGAGAGGQGASGANFGGQGGGGNRGGSTGTTGGGGRTSSTGSSSSRTSATGSASTGSAGGSGGSSGAGGSSTSGSLSQVDVPTAPQSVLVGRTLLVADNINNSIIVQGTPASLEVIDKLIDEVDVKPDQVMISTVFGQLTLNDEDDYGVQFLKTFGNKATGVAGGSTPTNTSPVAAVNPGSLLTPSLLPASNGLNIYGTIGRSYSIYLNALQSTGKFSVLSRPSIFTANNKKGVISSGQQIAVPTNTYNNTSVGGTTGGVQTNIEYKDVVLKLEVIPLINSSEEITMQISLVSDEVGANQTVGDLTVPTIITREMLTTVTVPNGQTVVLGGLIITRDHDDVSGIPILKSIPILGKALFSSTTKSKEKSELLIFMQPSIVRSSTQMDDVNTNMNSRYKVSPDLMNFADGPGGKPAAGTVPLNQKGGHEVQTTTETTTTTKTKVKDTSIAPRHFGPH